MGKEELKIIVPANLTQQVIDRIKQGILTKELTPGDQLPSNKELAKILGVKSTHIKEAIMYLTAIGVLEIHPQGTFISQGFSNNMMDPMIYGIILSQSDSLDTLKEMRKWIEFAVLSLAVTKASKREINQLSADFTTLKKELEKKNNLNKIVAADDDFYLTALNASHNSLLVNIAKTARTYTAEIRRSAFKRKLSKKVNIERISQNYADLLKAFRQKEIKDLAEIIMNDPLYD